MKQPDFQGAIEYARKRMARELPSGLFYHSLSHTFDEVLPASLQLGDLSHLDEYSLGLIAVAAAYHDIGWVEQGKDHEIIGVGIARRVLPKFDFQSQQIEQIGGMIIATRLPQSPHNLLEEIVVDADLDVLGRIDYWPRNWDLRAEFEATGNHISKKEWLVRQLRFLESHTYFTKAAQLLRNEQKQKNMGQLREHIAKMTEEFES